MSSQLNDPTIDVRDIIEIERLHKERLSSSEPRVYTILDLNEKEFPQMFDPELLTPLEPTLETLA